VSETLSVCPRQVQDGIGRICPAQRSPKLVNQNLLPASCCTYPCCRFRTGPMTRWCLAGLSGRNRRTRRRTLPAQHQLTAWIPGVCISRTQLSANTISYKCRKNPPHRLHELVPLVLRTGLWQEHSDVVQVSCSNTRIPELVTK
jgi:hypothetical protein